MRRALALLLALWTAGPVWADNVAAPGLPAVINGAVGTAVTFPPGGLLNGQAVSITIPSAILQTGPNNSSGLTYGPPLTDLPYALKQPWTGDVQIKGLGTLWSGIPPETTADYNAFNLSANPSGTAPPNGMPNYTAPLLTVAVTRPGFNSSATAITRSDTLTAIGPVRQPASTATNAGLQSKPTEGVTGAGNADGVLALLFDKPLYASDTVGLGTLNGGTGAGACWASSPATTQALYSIGSGSGNCTQATSNITVTNNSTRVYEQPGCKWATDPFKWYSNGPIKIEVLCESPRGGLSNQSVAAVTIWMEDNGGTCTDTGGSPTCPHYTIINPLPLDQAFHTICGSHGSTSTAYVLSGCTDITGFQVGQRVSVQHETGGIGDGTGAVPGEPIIGAIDTTATGGCSTYTPPCIELYTVQTMTVTANGNFSETTATANSSGGSIDSFGSVGQALFDQAFTTASIIETGAGGLISGTATPTAPTTASGWTATLGTFTTCGAGCGQATMTIGGSGTGQWIPGEFLTYTGSSSGAEVGCTNLYISANGSGTGGTGTYTVKWYNGTIAATSVSCNIPNTVTSLTGVVGTVVGGQNAGAGNQGTAGVATGAGLSTNLTTATAGSDTFKIEANYTGASGAVTVCSAQCVPAFKATFTTTDWSNLSTLVGGTSQGIHFRFTAYPWIGDIPLDSQSGVAGSQQGFVSNGLTASTGATVSGSSVTFATTNSFPGSGYYLEAKGWTPSSLNGIWPIASTNPGTSVTVTNATASGNSTVSGTIGQAPPQATEMGVGCDFFWNNPSTTGFNVCNSSNGAWFPNSGWVPSPNLHNLPAYGDFGNLYPTQYVFIDTQGTQPGAATCTSTSYACVFSATNAATTSNWSAASTHFSSIFTAAQVVQACNNLHSGCSNAAVPGSAHNDIGGTVFILLSSENSATGAFQGAMSTLCPTGVAPGIVLSQGATGTAPVTPFGTGSRVAVNPTAISFTKGTTNANLIPCQNTHFHNMALVDTSTTGNIYFMKGTDSGTGTLNIHTFPAMNVAFDNVLIDQHVNSLNTPVAEIGTIEWSNTLGYEWFQSNVLFNQSVNTGWDSATASIIGSTLVLGTSGTAVGTLSDPSLADMYLLAGNFFFNGRVKANSQVTAYGPKPTSEIVMFNKFMMSQGTPVITVADVGASENIFISTNLCEAIYNGVGCEQISNDITWGTVINASILHETTTSKTNFVYNDGLYPANFSAVTTGGSLSNAETITGGTLTSGTEVITSTASLAVGTTVTVAGVTPSSYNCTACVVTASTPGTNFTITNGSSTATYSSGGTAEPVYYYQVDYAIAGNPLAPTSTASGPSGNVPNATTFTATTGSATAGSLSFASPYCDPNYVMSIHIGTASGSLGHYATYTGAADGHTGVDAKAVNTCQTVTVTNIGSANAEPLPFNTTSTPMPATMKQLVLQGNIDYQETIQTDFVNPGVVANGGRIGDWEAWDGVWSYGIISIAGAGIGPCYGVSSSSPVATNCGWFQVAPNLSPNILLTGGTQGQVYDLSYIAFPDWRGIAPVVASGGASLVAPGVNIGLGNYCTTSANAANRIPSGHNPEPWDIAFAPWANDGTDSAGAYNSNLCPF